MANKQRIQQHLKDFTIRKLFIEELYWNVLREQAFFVKIDAERYTLRPLVEKGKVKVYFCDPDAQGNIPADPILRKIERELTKSAYEHIIVYVDAAKEKQVWQWVKRQKGSTTVARYSRLHKGQSGELLAQKLAHLFFQIEEEPGTPEVAGRLSQAFDTERVTKKFYERFQKELAAFLTFIEGITAQGDKAWYASLMLNRLMFIYFIQRQGFLNAKSDDELDGEPDYLRKRLELVQTQYGHDEFHTFYRYFLLNLFSDLNTQEGKRTRSREFDTLLGKIPYLNGGLFDVHQLERENPDIRIPDIAFKRIFDFFDEFDWHLDDRPLRNDKEINPDVLGYIFEKYINQKQMGAYYTKEDITEYISKNTIIPYLFEATKRDCEVAFEPGRSVWSLLRDNPDDYIYEAVAKGANLPLPAEIEVGLHDITLRGEWNKPAPEEFALPTEIWREVVARRQRYEQVHTKLANSEVTSINDLITYNLDICKFAQDVITYCEGTDLLNAFYKHVRAVTVLDPTCGSGAFLFAALNILKPLYEACLTRMEIRVDERERLDFLTDPKYRRPNPDIKAFQVILQEVATHHNRDYFILKSIIINNLYGVDIMEEATEICKLRLFLKLVSQVGRFKDIEPLPDIDFNIRAGNTLIGFTSLEDVRATVNKDITSMLFSTDILVRIERQAHDIERDTQIFREMQTKKELEQRDIAVLKQTIYDNLKALNATLDTCLAVTYKIDRNNKQEPLYTKDFKKWQLSHQPFHWYAQFYGIMQKGGFDVIVGNPPYVATKNIEYPLTKHYATQFSDLYAYVVVRSLALGVAKSRLGMIVPLSITFSEDFKELRKITCSTATSWFSSYDNIPAALFADVSQRCTIWLGTRTSKTDTFVTPMYRWRSEYRKKLTSNINYTAITTTTFDTFGIPKVASKDQQSVLQKIKITEDFQRLHFLNRDKQSKMKLGFSQAARNFVSIFLENPPCLDEQTLVEVASSKIGYINLKDEAAALVSLAALSGDTYFWYWLVRGDGFDVTNWIISHFLTSINAISEPNFSRLAKLGKLLHEKRFEALVFKKNAGKYVGNYNYHKLSYITRRADLLLLAELGASRDETLEILGYVQRVLSINERAGEKSIPLAIKSKFSQEHVHTVNLQQEIFNEIDCILAQHYGFTNEELDFIINYDIKYRMGRTSDEESEA